MLRLTMFLLLMGYFLPCRAQYFDTLHIHYDIGVAGLQKKDKAMLDSIARQSGNRRMLIYSYADYLGSERPQSAPVGQQGFGSERLFAEKRCCARTVYQYLTGRGISPKRMEYAGYGHTRLINDKEIDALHGHANMSVEVRVLEQ